MRRRHTLCLLLYLALFGSAAPVWAAGPLMVNGAGQPLAWTRRPIPFNPDRGGLGTLSNSDAVAFVAARFATWSAVGTASISFVNAGLLPVDVTAANVGSYFGVCGDNLDPIIFDADGSLIRSLFGLGNENFILGAAGPDCVSYVPPAITEASAILNGRFIDGVNSGLNPEMPLTDFGAVVTHELGHYIGLDHSQINLTEAFDGNPANDNSIATMFPILINGAQQSTLKMDDQVSVSMLYPAASFSSTKGAIKGSILRADGVTPFQGAYVIARNLANPRLNAVGVASGFLFFAGEPGGPPPASLRGYYELDGLTAGSNYSVEIEAIDPTFTQGSSVGPLDPPVSIPVPEFWNATEAATNPPDNPSTITPVLPSAGSPVSGVNIIMNSVSGTLPSNDQCNSARLVAAFPFVDSEDTTGAGESATDPAQICTNGAATYNTVWYALVPPEDGLVTFDTCGSSYDTVVTAFNGACAALTAISCSDDVGSSDPVCGASQSRVVFDVRAGQTYLVEVSQFGVPAGGALSVHATLGPRTCSTGLCLPGNGGPLTTQCMLEWLPEPPLTFAGTRSSAVNCQDGDTCDFDGSATNHSCTFHVAVCLNNNDPNLACTPRDTATVELLSPNRNGLRNLPEDTANADALLQSLAALSTSGSVLGICLNNLQSRCSANADCNSPGRTNGRCYTFVSFNPPLAPPDRCAVSANIVVPLRAQSNGTFRPNIKRLRVRANSSTARVNDLDTLTLRCLPGS